MTLKGAQGKQIPFWDSFSSIMRNWAILMAVEDEDKASFAAFRSRSPATFPFRATSVIFVGELVLEPTLA